MQPSPTSDLAHKLSDLGFKVKPGLTAERIEAINKAFGCEMPQDLKDLLTVCVPVAFPGKTGRFPDWYGNPQTIAAESRIRIDASLEFDITRNNYWCDEFGPKPATREEMLRQARGVVRSWPVLLPIYAHRVLPTVYSGNHPPILSFAQFVDTIIYGNNLYDYFIKEFHLPFDAEPTREELLEEIPYWGKAFAVEDE